jgi:hypothetical protein
VADATIGFICELGGMAVLVLRIVGSNTFLEVQIREKTRIFAFTLLDQSCPRQIYWLLFFSFHPNCSTLLDPES